MGFKAASSTFWSFIHGLLREPDGAPSLTRTLLVLFSIFDIWVIWRIIYYLLRVKDSVLLGTWLGNLPMFVGALIALTASPYAINRGTTTLSDLAGMIGKRPQTDGVQKVVDAASNQVAPTPTPVPVADPTKG